MLVGYARVSTQDQNLDLQRDALRQHEPSAERVAVPVGSFPSLRQARIGLPRTACLASSSRLAPGISDRLRAHTGPPGYLAV